MRFRRARIIALALSLLASSCPSRAGKAEEPEVEPLEQLQQSRHSVVKKEHKEADARKKAAAKDRPALRAKLGAAVAELKRDPGYQYVELEDILVDPAALVGRAIVVLGLAEYNSHVGYLDLASAGSPVPVDISALPAAQKTEVDATVTGDRHNFVAHAHAAVVKGRLQGSLEKGYRLAAEEIRFIPIPESVDWMRLPALLSEDRPGANADVRTMRDRLTAAIGRLKAEKTQYVEVEDLLLSRGKYSGQDIATIGMTAWQEESYLRSPYFDLTASFHESTNRIPVLMTGLELESRKELLRRQDLPHLVVVRGRVEETAGGKNYYLAAKSYEDLGDTLEDPAHILAPNLPSLAPFDGDVNGFRKKLHSGRAIPETEERAALDEFKDKLLAAIDSLKKDRRFVYAEIEDLGLEPDTYLDRAVAVVGIPLSVDAVSAMPHFSLANNPDSDHLAIPVLMSDFSADMRKEILRIGSGENIIVVRGRLRKSPDEKYYIEASGYSDLGRSQKDANHAYMALCGLLKGSTAYAGHREEPAKARQLSAVVEKLKREAGRQYVEFQALFRGPVSYAGRDISVVGLPFSGSVAPGREHFYLYGKYDSDDDIPVDASKLSLDEKKKVFKVMGEDLLVVRGQLKSSGIDGFYIEASACEDLGPFPIPHWGIPGYVTIPRIRF
jgi:hypothetical protein